MYSVRRQQAIDDYKQYGNFQKGTFQGIKWEARRNTPSPMFRRSKEFVYSPENEEYSLFYWCAYIFMTDGTFKKKYRHFTGISTTYRCSEFALEIVFHRDCDYPVGRGEDAQYRDFPFVLNVINSTIDKIIEDQQVVTCNKGMFTKTVATNNCELSKKLKEKLKQKKQARLGQ